MDTIYTIELVESTDVMYWTNSKTDAFNEYKRKYNNENFEVCEYISYGDEIDVDTIHDNARLFCRYNNELIEYLTND